MIRTLMYSLLACAVPVVVLISAARGIHLAEHGLQSSSFDLQQGRSIFAARCARCHNISGTSVAIGPNLSQIGTTAGQRKPGMTAAAYILESILKPREFKSPGSSGEMPANLVTAYDDEAIRNLVATLCSTPDTPQDNDIRSLQIDRPAAQIETTEFHREQIMRGERIYRGKAGCATCHPFYGGPELELTAPYIFFRGYRDREELRRAITSPHAAVAPRYQQTTVVLTDGNVLTGRLIQRDESKAVLIVLEQGAARRHVIDLEDVEKGDDNVPLIQKSTLSSMPSGIDHILAANEIDDLLSFLMSTN